MTRDEKVEFLKERYGLGSDEQLAKRLGRETRRSIHDYKNMTTSKIEPLIDLAIDYELLKDKYNKIRSISNIEAIAELIENGQRDAVYRHENEKNNIYLNLSQVADYFNVSKNTLNKRIAEGRFKKDLKGKHKCYRFTTVKQKLIDCGLLKEEEN